MKIYKHQMEQEIRPQDLDRFLEAGWSQTPPKQVKAEDEVIRLKPTVKTKATVTASDEANNKGDE